MKRFRVCVIEAREYVVEVEAEDEAAAFEAAREDYEEHSVSDQFRELTDDWCEEIKP